ncbi:hypothetical protein CUN60_06985 [Aquella oligotrophica]|uniref:Uncharacterized protein n=2 Tax=Aquella oligotrophica TaxID=2067065 RepID=A0A2I7N6F1_9NEIS|nr:hypothetical protein CUN60_06985 [Aquella oligotrophica]
MSMYKEFKAGLMSIIENINQYPDSYAIIADYTYASKFCNLLIRSIARKFDLEYDDLRSELMAEILAGNIFKQVIENKKFNRQVFYLNIKKLAIRMKPHEDSHHISLTEEMEDVLMYKDESLQSYVNKNAILKFKELRQVNLRRLIEYRSELLNSPINISKFQSVVELNTNELLEMLDQNKISRYQLLYVPNKYRKYLVSILDKYLQLYFKYYEVRSTYTDYLKIKTKSPTLKAIFEKLKPEYSYLQFTRKIKHPTLWDIDELEKLLLKVTNHA